MRARSDGRRGEPGGVKILFIHPFGIGDVIFSLAAAEALAARGHSIDYLCNERTEDLLRLCPRVRKTHRFDRSAIRADLARRPWAALARYAKLKRGLAAEKYDAVLDFSMGREYAFLAWWAGIRRRIGWDYKGRGWWLTDRVRVEGFDDRSPREFAMDLARIADPAVGTRTVYPALDLRAAEAAAGRWAAELAGAAGPRIVLAPGGGESWGKDAHYKRWPEGSWAELVRMLIRDTRANVIVLGSKTEEDLVRSVTGKLFLNANTVVPSAVKASFASAGPVSPTGPADQTRVISVIGEPLDRVLALLAGARVFVGTDGGLLHLANLVGTPSVGIYGPVSETGYAPLPTAAPSTLVTADVPCRPCYRRFRFTGCAHEKRCLTSITPEEVATAIQTTLLEEQ